MTAQAANKRIKISRQKKLAQIKLVTAKTEAAKRSRIKKKIIRIVPGIWQVTRGILESVQENLEPAWAVLGQVQAVMELAGIKASLVQRAV